MPQSSLDDNARHRVARAALIALHAALNGADAVQLDEILLNDDPTPRSFDEVISLLAEWEKPLWCCASLQGERLAVRCEAIEEQRGSQHGWTRATWRAMREGELFGTRDSWLGTFDGGPSNGLFLLNGVGYEQLLAADEIVSWATDYDLSTVGYWVVAANEDERARGIGAVVTFEGPRQIVEL